MMNNPDLLNAMLGGGIQGGADQHEEHQGQTILSFKAGKMDMKLQPNGKYLVTPDERRGTIEMSWTPESGAISGTSGTADPATISTTPTGILKLEWKDRRTRTTIDSLSIFPSDNCTYSKVDTGRDKDRVYLLQYGNSSTRRFFFWMQDKEEENEDKENCVKINKYMEDPVEVAAAVADNNRGSSEGSNNSTTPTTSGETRVTRLDISRLGGGGLDNTALMQIMQGLGGTSGNNIGLNRLPSSSPAEGTGQRVSNSNQPQIHVTTLSNLMQQFGMPRLENNASTTSSSSSAPLSTPAASSSSSGTASNVTVTAQPHVENIGGVLTLADLQGAITATTSSSSVPLSTTTPVSLSSNDMAVENANATPAIVSTQLPTVTTSNSVGLTLADLQGAMAGLATTSSPIVRSPKLPRPSLTKLLSTENIHESGILKNETIKARLINCLPEGQCTEENLMENLRSPQVSQCIKALTTALCDDAGESMEWFLTLLTNLDLDPQDGLHSMTVGNPIQAFLECILQNVERKMKSSQEENDGSGEGSEEDQVNDSDMSN